jgi:P-type conjugative transfer protein TrbJ
MSKLARIAAAALLCASATAYAQIPTTDTINAIQNTITANENVAHTLKQIQQYKTQLEQYAQQIKDATAPAAYVWDQATKTMDALRDAMFMLDYYKRKYTDIDTYLRHFNDVGKYRSSPCFGKNGCTAEQRAQLQGQDAMTSEAQQQANEAAIRTISQQQDAIAADAKRLEQLQRNAQTAEGQRAAIDAANMLAASQSNQLLQLRGLIAAQTAALTTRQQALADREAREAAAGATFRSGTYTKSPRQAW